MFYSTNNSILPQRDCRTRALGNSSWSCAALRQGHPASRDQLTDQEQCEAAKRITTRAKILSIDGPKTKRQKRSGFQGRQSGPPQHSRPPSTIAARVFQGCTVLQRLDLGKEGRDPTYPNRSLPDCCFLEAGIVALYLSSEFHRIGVAACTSCQQLQTVDLSQTDVTEILGSTFAHCSQLQQLSLSRNPRIIEQEAFLKCTSLQEVCIPPSLLYIARRAFAGCTQLRAVRKKEQSNMASYICPALRL